MGVFDSLRRALGPGHTAAEYRCPSCGRSFAYSEEIDEPTCPYCDTEDLVNVE